MGDFDTIIEGGYIVDGTGCPGTYADLAISNGKVVEIGNLKDRKAKHRIDAAGKIVAPGHITEHTHYDAALFWDPYCSDSGENGITTVANANCGFGLAPVKKTDLERCMQMMETTEQIPVAHQRAALPWNWETFPEYLDVIRQQPKGINISTYLPINPLLIYVMGVDAAKTRRPTEAEMTELHRLINEAMDAGALGISMSVMGAEGNSHLDTDGTPMPTDVIDEHTILELSRAVVERGEGVIQMLSQIVYFGDRSIAEKVAKLAHGTPVRIIHNVFLTHDLLPQMVDDDLAWLNDMRSKGYNITAGAQLNRGWIEGGLRELDSAAGQLNAIRQISACNSDEEVLALIRQPQFVQAFSEEYASSGPNNGAAGLEGQTILDIGDNKALEKYIDKSLGQIAAEEGRDIVEVLITLASDSELALQLKSGCISAEDPAQAMKLMLNPYIVPGGSDGGAHTKSFGMGHYPTDLLIRFAREEKLLSVEEMHFQLAYKPARSLLIKDRGALLPGYKADIIIYGLEELHFDRERYEIAHDMPNGDWRRKSKSGGYSYIIVNGEVTHLNDKPTGKTPGEFVQVTRNRG
ncbi:amidohydrolase family protein [Maricurvus nonylphenolicus]|uniref:N-acyl-D-amino-acid deacylase family protein n=1 Tax=Maricurvus nonylphenolicus TaxID=1008307 RepID=UPI0036F2FB61